MQLMWSAWVDEPVIGDTADPLGLHAAEVAVADALVPGFSGGTRHARSLALLLGGLVLVEPLDDRRAAFDRFDRMCVHAYALEEPGEPRYLSVAGILKARAAKNERDGRTAIDLNAPLTSGRGPAAAYRGLATALGLIEAATDAAGWDVLTAKGEELGRAALSGVDETVARKALEHARIVPRLLRPLGLIRPCAAAEKKLIKTALAGFRDTRGTASFQLLVRSGVEGVKEKKPPHLTDGQRELVAAALHLAKLVNDVENPFRVWVGTDKTSSVRAFASLKERLIEVRAILARNAPEARLPGFDGLVHAMAGGGRFADLYTHHRRLMATRGVSPWEWARPERGVGESAEDGEAVPGADSAVAAVQARLEALWHMARQVAPRGLG